MCDGQATIIFPCTDLLNRNVTKKTMMEIDGENIAADQEDNCSLTWTWELIHPESRTS